MKLLTQVRLLSEACRPAADGTIAPGPRSRALCPDRSLLAFTSVFTSKALFTRRSLWVARVPLIRSWSSLSEIGCSAEIACSADTKGERRDRPGSLYLFFMSSLLHSYRSFPRLASAGQSKLAPHSHLTRTSRGSPSARRNIDVAIAVRIPSTGEVPYRCESLHER
jgi:hypothetical protein